MDRNADSFNPVQRPNGKWYRPRKPARAELVTNDNGDEYKVIVIRTDDYEEARMLAAQEVQAWDSGYTASHPEFGWWRLGIYHGTWTWQYDDGRGAPGYMFDIEYMP